VDLEAEKVTPATSATDSARHQVSTEKKNFTFGFGVEMARASTFAARPARS